MIQENAILANVACFALMFTPTYPIFGAEIVCPHCHNVIPALLLTDSYLCERHGAFEANATTGELVHLQSGRRWRRWQERWFRQHTHADGIRFEIHEELERLQGQGLRATGIEVAARYQTILTLYLETIRRSPALRLYGLPVSFQSATADERWSVINFELRKEAGQPLRYWQLEA